MDITAAKVPPLYRIVLNGTLRAFETCDIAEYTQTAKDHASDDGLPAPVLDFEDVSAEALAAAFRLVNWADDNDDFANRAGLGMMKAVLTDYRCRGPLDVAIEARLCEAEFEAAFPEDFFQSASYAGGKEATAALREWIVQRFADQIDKLSEYYRPQAIYFAGIVLYPRVSPGFSWTYQDQVGAK